MNDARKDGNKNERDKKYCFILPVTKLLIMDKVAAHFNVEEYGSLKGQIKGTHIGERVLT